MDQTDDVPAGGVSEIIVEQIITRDRLDAAVGAVVGERRRQPRIVEARQIPKVDMGVDEGNLRHSTLSHLSGRRFLAGGCPLSVRRRQNVVRPPEVSKVDAVVKLHRSEEQTSELQSLMRISYAVFCLKKKKITYTKHRCTQLRSHITQQYIYY